MSKERIEEQWRTLTIPPRPEREANLKGIQTITGEQVAGILATVAFRWNATRASLVEQELGKETIPGSVDMNKVMAAAHKESHRISLEIAESFLKMRCK